MYKLFRRRERNTFFKKLKPL